MKVFLALGIIIVGIFVALFFTKSQTIKTATPSSQTGSASPTTTLEEKIDIIASFTIITNGISRNFSAKMYHNLSKDAYIENPNPSVVHVKALGVTWNDFFKTLPMKLTKECLTTGTKETFCTDANGTLRFYLNDIEDKDLMDRKIKEGDKVRITFSSL